MNEKQVESPVDPNLELFNNSDHEFKKAAEAYGFLKDGKVITPKAMEKLFLSKKPLL